MGTSCVDADVHHATRTVSVFSWSDRTSDPVAFDRLLDADQHDSADWRPDQDELDCVAPYPQDQDVEPAVAIVLDEVVEVLSGEPVRDGDEHRRDAPFQATAAGADRAQHAKCSARSGGCRGRGCWLHKAVGTWSGLLPHYTVKMTRQGARE